MSLRETIAALFAEGASADKAAARAAFFELQQELGHGRVRAAEPDAVSLTLEGPASVLDTLSSGDVSVLVAVGGREPASYRIAPDVILPAGVRLTEISVDTLDVRVYRRR